MLSLAVFGSLRPEARFDPAAHAKVLDTRVPSGTTVRQSTPHPAVFPDYARAAIANHLAIIAGRPVVFVAQLIEYPERDTLIRFKLVIEGFAQMPDQLREAISRRVAWCLPYALLI